MHVTPDGRGIQAVTSPGRRRPSYGAGRIPLEQLDDLQLMRALRGGHTGALGVLFERHHQRVHSFCFRMTGDAATADDLLQECFLRVLRFRDRFDGRSAFTTWLHTISRRVCLDHFERERREEERMRIVAMDPPANDPEAGELREQRLRVLQQALLRLPPEKRELIVLARFQQMPYGELAAVMECTVGALKVRMHRAMVELRAIVRELEQAT